MRWHLTRRQSTERAEKLPLLGETSYVVCTGATDTASWNPKVARFFAYLLSLKPARGLPGRQHFDPLEIPDLMPRVWILDVLREPLRYRETFGRFSEAVHDRVATYRKGNLVAIHKKEHVAAENCIVPMARDGNVVDMLIGFSVAYRLDGRES